MSDDAEKVGQSDRAGVNIPPAGREKDPERTRRVAAQLAQLSSEEVRRFSENQIADLRTQLRNEAKLEARKQRLADLKVNLRDLKDDEQTEEKQLRRTRSKIAAVEREIQELRLPPGMTDE